MVIEKWYTSYIFKVTLRIHQIELHWQQTTISQTPKDKHRVIDSGLRGNRAKAKKKEE